jgi:hypothetical protein
MSEHRAHRERSLSRRLLPAAALILGLGCGGGKGSPANAGAGGAGAEGGKSATGAGGSAVGGGAAGSGGGSAATVLAQGEAEPGSIVVDDSYLYWVTTTAVRRMPKTGGTASALFTALDSPDELKADDTALYWLNKPSNKDVMTGAKSGGQITTLSGGAGGGLVVDTDSAYWVQAAASGQEIVRVPKTSGGTPAMVASQNSFGRAVADDQFLYWAEGYKGRIQRVAKTGGTIMDLRPADPDTVILAALDTTDVYFLSYGATAQSSTLFRIGKTGGTTTTLTSGLDQASDLAVTTDAVYWLAPGDVGLDGALIKLSKTDGARVYTVPSNGPYRMAIDAQYVYWTEPGDHGSHNGRILRTAR